jgi:hypothetical protein
MVVFDGPSPMSRRKIEPTPGPTIGWARSIVTFQIISWFFFVFGSK